MGSFQNFLGHNSAKFSVARPLQFVNISENSEVSLVNLRGLLIEIALISKIWSKYDVISDFLFLRTFSACLSFSFTKAA